MRTILIFAIMLIPIAAFTQDSLKFMPNAWATEVNVNLLNGNISLNSSLNQIKIRKFVSSSLAYRLAFNFKNINQSSESKLTNPYYTINVSYDRQTFENNVNLGFEFLYGIRYKVYQDIIVKGEMSLPNLKESDFGYGSNVLNGLRIGYIF